MTLTFLFQHLLEVQPGVMQRVGFNVAVRRLDFDNFLGG
jgi:hypothetical protein